MLSWIVTLCIGFRQGLRHVGIETVGIVPVGYCQDGVVVRHLCHWTVVFLFVYFCCIVLLSSTSVLIVSLLIGLALVSADRLDQYGPRSAESVQQQVPSQHQKWILHHWQQLIESIIKLTRSQTTNCETTELSCAFHPWQTTDVYSGVSECFCFSRYKLLY